MIMLFALHGAAARVGGLPAFSALPLQQDAFMSLPAPQAVVPPCRFLAGDAERRMQAIPLCLSVCSAEWSQQGQPDWTSAGADFCSGLGFDYGEWMTGPMR